VEAEGLPPRAVELLQLPEDRAQVQDYVDATICAVVARRFVAEPECLKVYGDAPESSPYDDEEADELGPIYVLDDSR
jgi:hypothetical protein